MKPKKPPANKKLTPEAEEFLLQQVAQFATHQQAADRLAASELGIRVDRSAVTRLALEDPKRVRLLREEYLSSFDDTPLAHTKLRIQHLTRLFQEAFNALEKGQLRLTDGIELQREMLEAIRQEMNPIQHALVVGTSAKDAEDYLRDLGYGRADPRSLPPPQRPKDSH